MPGVVAVPGIDAGLVSAIASETIYLHSSIIPVPVAGDLAPEGEVGTQWGMEGADPATTSGGGGRVVTPSPAGAAPVTTLDTRSLSGVIGGAWSQGVIVNDSCIDLLFDICFI